MNTTENIVSVVLPTELIAPKHDPAANRNADRIVSPIGRQFVFAGGAVSDGLFGSVSLLID
jgi:hypothetical protein